MRGRGRPRDEQARQRIAEAACALFVREGYVATTIAGIARQAKVSPQTIYSAYTSKVGVLKAAHDFAIGGGDARPLLDREWAQSIEQMPTLDEAWRLTAGRVAEATEKVASIYFVVQSASADPDVALLLEELHEQRYRFSRTLADRLLTLPGVRPGAQRQRVADLLYACASIASYGPLVVECGWTRDEWQSWFFELGARELIEDQSAAPSKT